MAPGRGRFRTHGLERKKCSKSKNEYNGENAQLSHDNFLSQRTGWSARRAPQWLLRLAGEQDAHTTGVFSEHPRLPASRHRVDEDDFGGSKVNLVHPHNNRARGEATVFNRRFVIALLNEQ